MGCESLCEGLALNVLDVQWSLIGNRKVYLIPKLALMEELSYDSQGQSPASCLSSALLESAFK